jgi:hypothetical protein
MKDPVTLEVEIDKGGRLSTRYVLILERVYIDGIRVVERAHEAERSRFFLHNNTHMHRPIRSVARLYKRNGERIQFWKPRPIGMAAVDEAGHTRTPFDLIDEFVIERADS